MKECEWSIRVTYEHKIVIFAWESKNEKKKLFFVGNWLLCWSFFFIVGKLFDTRTRMNVLVRTSLIPTTTKDKRKKENSKISLLQVLEKGLFHWNYLNTEYSPGFIACPLCKSHTLRMSLYTYNVCLSIHNNYFVSLDFDKC